MKTLKEIIEEHKPQNIVGETHVSIEDLVLDAREASPRCAFFALKGLHSDGHNYIEQAITQGAVVIFCERLPEVIQEQITYVQDENLRGLLGCFAAAFYDYPSQKMKVVGITGTNGKTTVSTLLYRFTQHLGYKSALFSTITIYIDKQEVYTTLTTPDAITLQKYLRQALDSGCVYVFMEVSSHSIEQQRIVGIEFAMAGFTNITHDHLDYHKTFKAYLYTKKHFFDGLDISTTAITNADDKNGMLMLQNTKAKKKTYALKNQADYKLRILEHHPDGMLLQINQQNVWVALNGVFNAYNLLLTYAIAKSLGFEEPSILKTLSLLKGVTGRFEHFTSKTGLYLVVDYAHTPDALENILKSLITLRKSNEKLWVIFGCGGERDKKKRAIMGHISSVLSDKVIITSDNPRGEDPRTIIDEVKQGVNQENKHKVSCIIDRKEAIEAAILQAEPNDMILVAGKGHEAYQEINGVKHPFNDRLILEKTLKKNNK